MNKIYLVISLILFYNCQSISQSGWVSQNLGSGNFVCLNFINNSTGYIFKQDGAIFMTTNAGVNWILFSNSGLTEVRNGIINSPGISYTKAQNGMKKSANSGLNWETIPPVDIITLGLGYIKNIFLKDINTIYAVVSDFYPLPEPNSFDGIIVKTTNAGQNWIEIYRENYCDFTDIIFKNNDTGFALANYFITRTTNAGSSWIRQSEIGVYGVSMSNPFVDTIDITGYGGKVIRSIDGGNSWNISISGFDYYDFRKLHFLDSKYGCVVGDSGTIIRTTNAGLNWTIQNSHTRASLYGVWFLNKDTGFVVGDSGVVLRTTTGGLTYVQEGTNIVPSYFTLEQNYPNPFNPKTVINYQLAVSSFATLKVYGLLGNAVKTLVNQKQNPGSYEVEFDATGFPSGIYFYKLWVSTPSGQVNGYNETKKMMLIR